jgi:hypothetical protein
MIKKPNDFTECFEVLYGVAALYHDEEVVLEASSGTREMITAAEIVSFLTRNPVSHVTGGKWGASYTGTDGTRDGLIRRMYDRLQLHRAISAFNHNHFGSSIRLLENITSLPERDTYYALFNAYWHWDKMDYKNAYRYLEHVPDLHLLIPQNRKFLKKLLELDQMDDTIFNRKERLKVRQQKYMFMLIDLLHYARAGSYGERYDDAGSTTVRVIELISQVLLLHIWH